jgi:hypothetical protein
MMMMIKRMDIYFQTSEKKNQKLRNFLPLNYDGPFHLFVIIMSISLFCVYNCSTKTTSMPSYFRYSIVCSAVRYTLFLFLFYSVIDIHLYFKKQRILSFSFSAKRRKVFFFCNRLLFFLSYVICLILYLYVHFSFVCISSDELLNKSPMSQTAKIKIN